MNNTPETILYASLFLIAIYYFSKAENVLVKWAIFCYVLIPLPRLIKTLFDVNYPIGIVSMIALLVAPILIWLHLSKNETLIKRDVLLIKIFLVPFFFESLATLAFRPLSVIGVLLAPISIGILIYYSFKYKDADYLTDEMRIMNLFGIQIVIGIVKTIYKFA